MPLRNIHAGFEAFLTEDPHGYCVIANKLSIIADGASVTALPAKFTDDFAVETSKNDGSGNA
ncbi:MAG: hypothetical protein ACRCV9_14680 [Burkholderiaceae bacterium]